jgi:DnaJ family protein C protein 9
MSDEADPILTFFSEKESENPEVLYIALGVQRDSHVDDIRKAYRKAALRCHPDKHAGKSETDVKKLNAEFQKIGFAWAVLSDEKRRKR